MSSKLRSLIALSCLLPVSAMAEVTVYGKISLAAQQNSTETPKLSADKKSVVVDESSTTTLEDNVSRLGFKGSEKLLNLGIEAFYLAEFAVWADDGSDTAGSANAFRQRNIYVGAKGTFGSAIAGNFDTPLKTIQNKVDLFNDWRGDINTFITVNDYRRKNSIMYTTPKMAGFTGYVDVIMTEVNSELPDATGAKGKDNAASLALAYEKGGFYAAAAYDQNVVYAESANLNDESSVYRLVAQYTLGSWQFGALYDNHDATANVPGTGANANKYIATENQGAGWILSTQYLIDKWALKVQYGQSDILRGTELDRDADVLSLGVDYKYSKNGRFYGFYTMENADLTLQPALVGSQSNDFVGLGMEMNF